MSARDPDLDGMSRQELLDLQHVVLGETRDIKQQIEDAKRRWRMTGDHADSEWYRKATYALRSRGILLTLINTRLGRDREERKARNVALAAEQRERRLPNHLAYLHHFARAAKRGLDGDTYARLAAEAAACADAGDQFDCSDCLGSAAKGGAR